MAAFHHGITATESSDAIRALVTVSTAVIGVVVTGPAADGALFPLDAPVLVTDIDAAIDKAGTTGTLRAVLTAIADQVDPVLVVVRVNPGANAAETSAAVIGGTVAGRKTGMQALLAAEGTLGVKPRILACPGLDTQPVTTALAIVAARLRGMAYAAAIGADIPAMLAYRANFAARELMLIAPDFVAFDQSVAANAVSYATARAVGLRAKIDQETGWHKTLSNVPVVGVVGVTRDIEWDVHSPSTEAGILNAGGVTTIVRTPTGYRFWGNRTCAEDPLFAFESTVRTAQVLLDTIAGGMLWAIDKPLTPSLAKDIVEVVNAELRSLKAGGRLLGGAARFDQKKNSASTLAGGILDLSYDYTPVPPLENLRLTQTITDSYLADFSTLVANG